MVKVLETLFIFIVILEPQVLPPSPEIEELALSNIVLQVPPHPALLPPL
jgi:hypothetical protein